MKCSFCKQDIESGTGSMQVLRSGKVLHFCSSKCRKNHALGRNPKKLKWVTKQ